MLLVAWLSSSAEAFTVKQTENGDPLKWRSWPVSFTFTGEGPPDVADPEGDVRAAFEIWRTASDLIVFEETGPVAGVPEEAPDDVNWVWVSDEWPFDPELLALTSSWTSEDGTLLAFDIRVNGTKPWASDGRPDAYDFRAAMVHEVGHVLGLDHSSVEEATMFATSGTGEPWRANLDADDEAGALFLYPEVAAVTARPSLFGCATSPTVGSSAGIALAAVAGLRRRR